MHGGAAVALVVAVIAVAYGTAAPQLAVAEFAPAAQKELEAPATTAAASAGAAERGRRSTTTLPASATASPTTDAAASSSSPTTRQARGRPCFGTPPRQIDDPLSPPCMPTIFEGDNGGATSSGVNATEIRVGVPAPANYVTDAANPYRDGVMALFEYMNRHFELYGRRLVPVLVPGSANDAVTSRTQGQEAAAKGLFAALSGIQEANSRTPQAGLVQEMARAGVVTVVRASASWWTDRTMYDAFHPYVWSLYPSSEQLQRNLGAAACAVAGRPASHTIDADLAGKTRRFGIVAGGSETPPATGVLADVLRSCTDEEPVRVEWAARRLDSQGRKPALSRLAAEGVTSVICVCEGYEVHSAAGDAHAVGYDPEWSFSSTTLWDSEYDFKSLRLNGVSGLIQEVQPGRRWLPLAARPWFPAMLEVHPTLLSGGLSNMQGPFIAGEYLYDSLLLLASGIQGAGPALTPHSFSSALMALQFPNPGSGQAPYWQPSVGFGPGDHSFYNDYAVAWFSDDAPAVQPWSVYRPGVNGSWCYVGGGARFQAGTFPADLDSRVANPNEPCR